MPAPSVAPARFSPRLVPTLTALVGIVVLVLLGNWQLRRLAWKEDLIATTQARINAPVVPVPADPDADYAALDYRHVTARGRYLGDRAFGFGFSAREDRGGGELVVPLRLDDGRTLLVDRGWVPSAMLPPATPPELEQQGEVEVAGVARYRGDYQRPFFQPADDPSRRRWFGWDLPTMAQAVGQPLLPIVLVAQGRPGDPPLPQPEPVSVDFPNDHLQYALTWYGLAAALAVVYLVSSFRKPDGALP